MVNPESGAIVVVLMIIIILGNSGDHFGGIWEAGGTTLASICILWVVLEGIGKQHAF